MAKFKIKRATGIREISDALISTANLQDPRTKKSVLAALDKAATEIIKVVKQRNYGFKDRSGKLRRAIQLQGFRVRRTAAARWVGVQGDNKTESGNRINYYSRRVEYDKDGRFSYLRRARREIVNRGLIARDLAGRLSKDLKRRLEL